MLRPSGVPPAWHTLLDYIGLFLFYFAGTLAALVLAARCWHEVRGEGGVRVRAAAVLTAITTLLAAAPLVVDAPAALSLTLEAAFAAAVIAILPAAFGPRPDRAVPGGPPAAP